MGRTRTTFSPRTYGYWQKDLINNGVRSIYESGTHETGNGLESIQDFVTKNYKSRIAQGHIINNPCSYERSSFIEEEGSYYASHKTLNKQYEGFGPVMANLKQELLATIHPFLNLPAIDVGSVISDATQQCVADINSSPNSFAEDTLEVAETLRFLKNPGRSLYKLAEDVQKRSWKIRKKKGAKARQVADALNDLFLTRQFALRPLVHSAFDAVDALNSKLDYNAARYNARGFSSKTETYSGVVYGNATPTNYYRFQVNNSIKVSVHAYVLYTHRDKRGGLHKYGVRGDDGFVGLWNVVPLSFMVDRMYDISSFIRGFNALSDPKLKVLTSGYVKRTHKVGKISVIDQVNPSYDVSVSGSQSAEEYFYTRYTDWHPSLRDVVPVFKPQALIKDAQSTAELFSLSAGILSRSLKPARY